MLISWWWEIWLHCWSNRGTLLTMKGCPDSEEQLLMVLKTVLLMALLLMLTPMSNLNTMLMMRTTWSKASTMLMCIFDALDVPDEFVLDEVDELSDKFSMLNFPCWVFCRLVPWWACWITLYWTATRWTWWIHLCWSATRWVWWVTFLNSYLLKCCCCCCCILSLSSPSMERRVNSEMTRWRCWCWTLQIPFSWCQVLLLNSLLSILLLQFCCWTFFADDVDFAYVLMDVEHIFGVERLDVFFLLSGLFFAKLLFISLTRILLTNMFFSSLLLHAQLLVVALPETVCWSLLCHSWCPDVIGSFGSLPWGHAEHVVLVVLILMS